MISEMGATIHDDDDVGSLMMIESSLLATGYLYLGSEEINHYNIQTITMLGFLALMKIFNTT